MIKLLHAAALSALMISTAQAGSFAFTFNENPLCAENTCFNYRLGETGSGTLSFDASNITGTGVETRQLSGLTGASFSYTLTIIPGWTVAQFTTAGMSDPTFEFTDGFLTGMSFTTVDPTFHDTLTVSGLAYEHRDANNRYSAPSTLDGQLTINQRGTISVTSTATPEPGSMLLVGLGAVCGVFATRRRR